MNAADAVEHIAGWFIVAWTMVASISNRPSPLADRPSPVHHVRRELRPFVVPVALIGYLASVHPSNTTPSMWDLPFLASAVVLWWLDRRNDNDDRWKRRRRKLASKVAEAGGKLVVVPAGAPG